LLAAAVRVAAVPLPGTTDLRYFTVWARAAAADGVGTLYGRGGPAGERRVLEIDGVRTKVDYPPVALYELELAGLAPPASVPIAIKSLCVVAESALVLLIYASLRRRPDSANGAACAALSMWLNPAAVLAGSVLGYLDPLWVLPAVAALVAAVSGRAAAAGALIAIACLTKPLGVFVVPCVALALVNSGRGARRSLVSACAAAAVVSVIAAVPVVLHGGLMNMAWALGSLLRDPFLSGNGASIWAMAGAVAPGIPTDAARAIGTALTIGAIAWACWRLRHAHDLSRLAALGALCVHAYATLAAAVHENHAFAAVPLLAIAWAGRAAFRGPFVAVSAIVAMNFYLAYGFGVDVPFGPPASVAGLDPLVWLSAFNLATFAWTLSIFRRECRPDIQFVSVRARV
jgi:hypothetical protein